MSFCFSGSLISSLVLPSGFESSLGDVSLAALGLGVVGRGKASGVLTLSTLGRFASSIGTWTGVEGVVRIINDAVGIVSTWTSNDAATQ